MKTEVRTVEADSVMVGVVRLNLQMSRAMRVLRIVNSSRTGLILNRYLQGGLC
jgi:hypothetical protein